VLPVRLKDPYHLARTDPELLALQDEIAMTDARLVDLLARVDSGESGQLWLDLKRAWEAFKLAREMGRPEDMRKTLVTIESLLTRGIQDYEAWREVQVALEQRRRLVETEHRRRVNMQQMMSFERAMALFGAIVGVIETHVPDRAIRAAISADLRALGADEHGQPS
jgi:hypothetical protein